VLPAFFLIKIEKGHKQQFKCPCKCLKSCNFSTAPYCIALALVNAKRGNLYEGFAFAGHNAYKINKIVSVKDLLKSLVEEYSQAAYSAIR
jgi:hypothetical protein